MKTLQDEFDDEKKNLVQIGGVWYVRAMVNGVMIKQSLHTRILAEARILREERLAAMKATRDEKTMLQSVQRQLDGISVEEDRQRKEANQGVTFDKMWKQFETSPSRDMTEEKRQTRHFHWTCFTEWMKGNHPLVLHSHQVTRSMAHEYAAALWSSKRMSSATYNIHIATLRMIFEDAMDRDEDLNNPFIRVKRANSKTNRREIFTDEELRRMFADDDPEFVRFCAIGLYTTQRLNVAKSITWEMFSKDLTMLYVTHHKTGADGTMTVPEPLREILLRVPEEERHGFVCPTYGPKSKSSVCHMFSDKIRRLEIMTNAPKPERGARQICVHGYHSFRHTAVTLALRNGATPAEVKRLAGHATDAMQEHYTHFGAEDAGRASDKIGKFF